MAKNIVIYSDGTGNRGGKTRGTNVWRIYNAVDRHCQPPEQIAYYDDGVGTGGGRWGRLVTGAVGYGLARNIREAYAFLAMNYAPGDKIFLFGFSRGAFTVRSLAGLICKYGVPTRAVVLKAGHKREAMLRRILWAYRSTDSKAMKHLCKAKKLGADYKKFQCVDIHFIGVWDTVDAVGLPFDELKKALSCLWAKIMRRWWWNFHDYQLHERVRYTYHALALDDERKTFHPVLWETSDGRVAYGTTVRGQPKSGVRFQCQSRKGSICCCGQPKSGVRFQTVEQVWFAGAHANVGGGYPKDSLAFIALDWMMGKAERCGLRFFHGARTEVQQNADAHGRLYDSRAGWGMFYRPALRNPYKGEDCPKLHGSVHERIKRGTQYYAPKVLTPGTFTVVWTDQGPYAKPDNDGTDAS